MKKKYFWVWTYRCSNNRRDEGWRVIYYKLMELDRRKDLCPYVFALVGLENVWWQKMNGEVVKEYSRDEFKVSRTGTINSGICQSGKFIGCKVTDSHPGREWMMGVMCSHRDDLQMRRAPLFWITCSLSKRYLGMTGLKRITIDDLRKHRSRVLVASAVTWWQMGEVQQVQDKQFYRNEKYGN